MRMGVGRAGCSLDVGAASHGLDPHKIRRVTVVGGVEMRNDRASELVEVI